VDQWVSGSVVAWGHDCMDAWMHRCPEPIERVILDFVIFFISSTSISPYLLADLLDYLLNILQTSVIHYSTSPPPG
jgi:hypothetical protein